MRRRLALALLLALAGPAAAQSHLTTVGAGAASVSACSSGYVGPGDQVTTGTFFIGLYSFNCAYSNAGTGAAADICDTSTGAVCTTVNFLTSGKFDKTTAAALTQCSVSCSAKKLYDSTGNGRHFTPASIGVAPVLVFNCINTNDPCLRSTSAGATLMAVAAAPVTAPYSLTIVAKRTSAFTSNGTVIVANATPFIQMRFTTSANTVLMNDGSASVSTTASDSTMHFIAGATGSSQVSIWVDNGTIQNVSSASPGSNSGQWDAPGGSFNGDFLGVGAWSGKFSGAQVTSMNTLTHSILGF